MEIERKSSNLPAFNPSKNTLTILAMIGGTGLVLAILALAFGSAGGAETNSNLVGLSVLAGLLLLVMGIGGWAIATQPYKHFDDINQPLDDGHHGHAEAHEESADDHATSESHH